MEKSPKKNMNSSLYSTPPSPMNTPVFVLSQQEKNLINQYWVPLVLRKLDNHDNNAPSNYDELVFFYKKFEDRYLKANRYLFLFKQEITLTTAIRDYILIKYIDYPANTVKHLTDDFLLDYPEVIQYSTYGSVLSLFRKVLNKLFRINLMMTRIIPDTQPKNTTCFCALWYESEQLAKVNEIYDEYKQAGETKMKPQISDDKIIEKKVKKYELTDKAKTQFKKNKLSNTKELKEDHDLKVAQNIMGAEVSRSSKIASRKIKDHRIKQIPKCAVGHCPDPIKSLCKKCLQAFCSFHGSTTSKGHFKCQDQLLTNNDFEILETDIEYSSDKLLAGNTNLQLKGGSDFD